MSGAPIAGAKVALLHGAEVLAILRDDIPTIPWPGCWDLPGGGHERGETAEACVLREVREELGLDLPAARLLTRADHPSASRPGAVGVFFTARILAAEIAAVRFGDEGQGWRMMPVAEFVAHPRGVPHLQARLAEAVGLRDQAARSVK